MTTVWLFVALVIAIAILFRPAKRGLLKALDERAEKIRTQLDEAQKLREDAQHLLAELKRKQRDAAKECEDIIAHAQSEAETLVRELGEDVKERLARREQQAKDKIAQAEAQAVTDVRRASVDMAIAASRGLIASKMSAQKANALIDGAIAEVPDRLS